MIQQTAQFIFKLRNNISLEGDVKLAEMEIQSFLPNILIKPITAFEALINQEASLSNFKELTALNSYARRSGLYGYIAIGNFDLLPVLIRRLSFVQNIYCLVDYHEKSYSFLSYCERILGEVLHYEIVEERLIICAIPHFTLIELSDVVARRAKNASETKQNLQFMLNGLLNRNGNLKELRIAEEALKAQNTTSHLSHDIHYYKAKFFPRLVRSTLNICNQKLGGTNHRVIDCFSGSGTTLLEAAMLDMESFGIDIDPLSVLIAKSKIEILQIPSSHLSDEVSAVLETLENQTAAQLNLFTINQNTSNIAPINFPTWLMKNRKMSQEIAMKLISEIQQVRVAVATASPELQDFFQVLMSDAIARKIKMRFLGTGVGRFSLSFTQKSIPSSFKDSAERYVRCLAAVEWLKQTIKLTFSKTHAFGGDARKLGTELGLFDIALTSPPYLPAASGRESYAKARMPSLIALGMKTHENIDLLVDDSIGAMIGGCIDTDLPLLDGERDAVEWLKQDELRSIKSYPTARYFLDMREAFNQMHCYLRPGAYSVIVSGKQSTFYQFSTRKELYVVQSAEILAEEAKKAGFEVEGMYDVQLQKANKNARPRSLDDYYETLIYLRRS
jgi:hypothetical protein